MHNLTESFQSVAAMALEYMTLTGIVAALLVGTCLVLRELR